MILGQIHQRFNTRKSRNGRVQRKIIFCTLNHLGQLARKKIWRLSLYRAKLDCMAQKTARAQMGGFRVSYTTNQGEIMANKFKHGDSFPYVPRRTSRLGDNRYCQVCARELGQSGFYYATVVNGGEIWDTTKHGEPDTNDAGYLGRTAVGIACANRFELSTLTFQESN